MRTALVLAVLVACASPSQRRAPAEEERAAPAAAPAPGQGRPCSDGACAPGLRCVRYYGIAGPKGPAFSSCELSCVGADGSCPEGQRCATIADGPGRVCRPHP